MPKHKANSGSPCILRCRWPIMLLGLKCILFNFIAMCPSELNVHAYVGPMPPVLTKKREKKRRVDNTVVQSLLVTTTAGQDGGTNSGGTNTTWTGSRPDARQPDGSRSVPAIGTLPSDVRSAILHHGTCRPKVPFAISSENGNRRMLSEAHYHAHSGAMEMERQWLGFSSTMKKPSGKSCWLLGDPSPMQKEWDNGVSGKPKNYGV